MRTLVVPVLSLCLLAFPGCGADTGATGVNFDGAAGSDNQISAGSDAAAEDTAAIDVAVGSETVSADSAAAAETTTADVATDAVTVVDTATSSGCSVGSAECGAGKYCSAPVGQCSGKGTCAAKPEACTMEYGPICGCDGKDYGHGCTANAAGVVMAKGGSCNAAPSVTKWYTTCGAPVCQGVKPTPSGEVACTTQVAGASCTTAGAQCDLQNACQQKLLCTDKDPTLNPGGCPKSRRALKTDIRYLDAAAAAKLNSELLATKLATYRYRDAGPDAPQQLGFIIDDQPESPAVDARRDMVDLYGYLSMSVAAIQTQQRQLAQQARRIEELERAIRAAPVCR